MYEDDYDEDEEDEYYDIFIYPLDLDSSLVEMLKKSLRALDYRLFAYSPGERRSRAILENAFEVLGDCEFTIFILTPKNVDSALLNQFAGFARSMEMRMACFSTAGTRAKGLLSLTPGTGVGGSDPEEIVSNVLKWIIKEEEIEDFSFRCLVCREEEGYELPTPEDHAKWERSRQAYEVEAACGHMNRFNPKTMLPP